MHGDGGCCSNRQHDESCCEREKSRFWRWRGVQVLLKMMGEGLACLVRTHSKWILVQTAHWGELWALLTWV